MALSPARRWPGVLLVALAGIALLAGLWGGLVRIGWPWPPLQPDLASAHGPLMVAGFLGLVVGLERAVALGRTWGFSAPGLAALGALALIGGLPFVVGAALFAGSSLVLVVIFGHIYRLRPEPSSALFAIGTLAWLVGNALWLTGRPLAPVVPWWAGFLVLTIAGERLELAQVLLPFRSWVTLMASAGVFLTGLVLSVALYTPGVQLAGLGLLALSGWLLRYDVARRTLRRRGTPPFSGLALMLGYLWLGIGGLLWALGPERVPGPFWYDAMVHSVFLGFVLSMILGHAPIILPAVTGLAVPFQGRFYVPLALLHSSLLLRIGADLAVWPEARRWGGLLNVIALLLFLVLTLGAVIRGRRGALAQLAPGIR